VLPPDQPSCAPRVFLDDEEKDRAVALSEVLKAREAEKGLTL